MYPPLENFTICITIVWTFKKVHIKSNRRKAKYVLARTYLRDKYVLLKDRSTM